MLANASAHRYPTSHSRHMIQQQQVAAKAVSPVLSLSARALTSSPDRSESPVSPLARREVEVLDIGNNERVLSDLFKEITSGLQARYVYETNLPPDLSLSDSDIDHSDWFNIPNLREAERKATQGIPKHPALLTIEWIFRAICYKISHWLYEGYHNERAGVLENCHLLECHNHLSPKLYLDLKKNLHNPIVFKELTFVYLNELKAKHFLDTKAHKHVTALLLSQGDVAVWRYLNIISTINSLTNNIDDACDFSNSKESLRLLKDLKKISENTSIEEGKSKKLTTLLSRIRIMKWINGLSDSENETSDLVWFKHVKESIKSGDEESFRKQAISALRYSSRKPVTNSIQNHYFSELANVLEKRKGENSFNLLSHALLTETFISNWQEKLCALKREIKSTTLDAGKAKEMHERLLSTYRIFGAVIEEEKPFLCSDTLFSQIYGDLRSQWLEISDHLHKSHKGESTSHAFCGCVNQNIEKIEEATPWPISATTVIKGSDAVHDHSSVKPRKKVLCLTCSWGGGHRAAATAVESFCSKKGYHFTAVDAPQEIFIGQDVLQKAIGGDYSITKLYNTLVARQAWGVIRLLSRTSGGESAAAIASEVEIDLVRQRILMERPDMIVSSYSRHNHIYLKVAQELGIPIVHIQTDFEMEITSWDSPPEYPHYKMITPCKDPVVLNTLKGKVRGDQVESIGYPLRKEFIHRMTLEEVQSVRDAYAIPLEKKVVTVMGGAIGTETPWAKMIMDQIATGAMAEDCHLVVICGHNTPYREKLNKFILENPEIKDKVSVLGFVSGKDVAGIMHASTCLVTKPGGGTVAEALTVGVRLVLDQSDKSFMTWEQFNAKYVEDNGAGISFKSKGKFIACLSEQLLLDRPKPVLTPDIPQDEAYMTLFNDMIVEAEADPVCVEKQKYQKVRLVARPIQSKAMKGFRMEASLTQLEAAFRLKAFSEVFQTEEEVFSMKTSEALAKGKFVKYNDETRTLAVIDEFSEINTLELLDNMIAYYEHGLSNSGAIEIRDSQWSNMHYFTFKYVNHLKEVISNSEKLFSRLKGKGIQSKKIKDLMTKLDRYQATVTLLQKSENPDDFFQQHSISDNENTRVNLYKLERLLLTEDAKKEFRKWACEKTSRGRKKGVNEYMMTPFVAAKTFFSNPLAVDFIKDLHIHRHMSSYDEKIVFNTDGLFTVKVNGKDLPISSVLKDYTFFLNRIIEIKTGRECFYCQGGGLQYGSPDSWEKGVVPVFKTKDRKTKDYRLEICTVVSPETHAWIRLKSPDGKVYSVGKFWDKDVDLPGFTELVKTVPAMLRIDYHEFKGEEAQIKRTKVPLTEEKFNEALAHMVTLQKKYKADDGGFNLASSNCSGFVKEIAKIADLKIETKYNVLEYIAGSLFTIPSPIRKFLYKHNKTRKAFNVILYPVSLLRNTLLFCLGGSRHIGADGLSKDNVFTKFSDIFYPSAGMVEHPMQIRTWQEVRQEEGASIPAVV